MVHYYTWSDGIPQMISKKQFDNFMFFLYNVLPLSDEFITKKRFKNDVSRCVVTHICFDDMPILSFVRCF